MDGRLLLFLIISISLWVLNIPNHRRFGHENKIYVPMFLAKLVGAKDKYIDWRSFSIQVGSVTFFLAQLILLKLQFHNFMLYGAVITIASILVTQLLIRLLYRT